LPQRKVGRLLVTGALWIAAGLVLHAWVRVPSRAEILLGDIVHPVDPSWHRSLWLAVLGFLHESQILLIGPCLLGIRRWWLAIRAVWDRDLAAVPTVDAIATPAPARPERPLGRVLPVPARLGDDPFRDPPRPPTIIVVRPDSAGALTPVVPEVSGRPPKILN